MQPDATVIELREATLRDRVAVLEAQVAAYDRRWAKLLTYLKGQAAISMLIAELDEDDQ